MNILTRITNLFRRRARAFEDIEIIKDAIEVQQHNLAEAIRTKQARKHIYARLEALRTEQLRLEALRNG